MVEVPAVLSTVAVLYPGAMGSAVGRCLRGVGRTVVSYVEERSPRTREAADDSGIALRGTLDEVVLDADIVLSLVPQHAVLDTARAFSDAVRRTGNCPLYVDANSVAPATVNDVCSVVEQAGCECVDGSFIGNDKMLGFLTTLYLSGGPGAHRVAAAVGGAMRTKVIGTQVGLASAFKLCFWGFNKGVVALFLDMLGAAEAIGQRDELLCCLLESYPGTMNTVERLLPTYPRHAARRAEEMSEVEEWLISIGSQAGLAIAARNTISRFSDLGMDADRTWALEDLVDTYCARLKQ